MAASRIARARLVETERPRRDRRLLRGRDHGRGVDHQRDDGAMTGSRHRRYMLANRAPRVIALSSHARTSLDVRDGVLSGEKEIFEEECREIAAAVET